MGYSAPRKRQFSYTKTIVCLANSRKPHGTCVAGREFTGTRFGHWIRPVSSRISHELVPSERCYRGGVEPKVLDIVRIGFLRAEPHEYQQENHVIDAERCWERCGRVTWSQLRHALDIISGPLWFNGSSSCNGHNDRVPEEHARRLRKSLYLIRPNRVELSASVEGEDYADPRRRVRARFQLSGATYRLSVTDPVVESWFRYRDEVVSDDNALLCVSLGEPFMGFAYKLVAAVITPRRQNA